MNDLKYLNKTVNKFSISQNGLIWDVNVCKKFGFRVVSLSSVLWGVDSCLVHVLFELSQLQFENVSPKFGLDLV